MARPARAAVLENHSHTGHVQPVAYLAIPRCADDNSSTTANH
jgi:hypothetical protein